MKKPMQSMASILSKTFYSNAGDRRYQETADARMIHEDHSAIGNLPQQPINKEFKAWKYVEKLESAYNDNGIDDEW